MGIEREMRDDLHGIPIILGGGLAGLSAAYHGGGIIYEKESQYGGMCRSPVVNGYRFDLGIHVLHTRNESILRLLRKLKLELVDQSRDAWIYSYEKLTRYPFQANTFGLPIPIVKECLETFVEAYCKNKADNEGPVCTNYEEWITAAFGRGIARHFMIPYSEKFWTVRPSEMTTDWIDVRVPMPNLGEVIEGALTDQDKGFGPNSLFKYPLDYGIQALPRAFVESGLKIHLDKEAVKIDLENRKITFSDGETNLYSSLISTIPLPELFRLFDAPPGIKAVVDDLRYNSILCVNIGVDREDLNEKHWIYYPEEKYPFFRISFLRNFSFYLVPENKSSITAEIAYSKERPIDKENISETVIKGLIDAGILARNDYIEFVDLRDLKYGYVIFDHRRRENLDKIKRFLMNKGIITAGRYGAWEYQWMDDAILDGIRAAQESQQFARNNHVSNG